MSSTSNELEPKVPPPACPTMRPPIASRCCASRSANPSTRVSRPAATPCPATAAPCTAPFCNRCNTRRLGGCAALGGSGNGSGPRHGGALNRATSWGRRRVQRAGGGTVLCGLDAIYVYELPGRDTDRCPAAQSPGAVCMTAPGLLSTSPGPPVQRPAAAPVTAPRTQSGPSLASCASCSSLSRSRWVFWLDTHTPNRTSCSWPSTVIRSLCWRGTTCAAPARCTARAPPGPV